LIETAEGLANVDEIMALDGIDGCWMGHFDLSCSMGIPGEFQHPDFLAAIERIASAAKRNHKPAARVVSDVGDGAAQYANGFEIIAVSGDCWLLQQAMQNAATALREQCTQ